MCPIALSFEKSEATVDRGTATSSVPEAPPTDVSADTTDLILVASPPIISGFQMHREFSVEPAIGSPPRTSVRSGDVDAVDETDPWTTDSTDSVDDQDVLVDDAEDQHHTQAPSNTEVPHNEIQRVSRSVSYRDKNQSLSEARHSPFLKVEQDMYKDCTFSPQITSVAKRLKQVNALHGTNKNVEDAFGRSLSMGQAVSGGFTERLYTEDVQRRAERTAQKVHEARLLRLRTELQEFTEHCTFQPTINARSTEMSPSGKSPDQVFSRLYSEKAHLSWKNRPQEGTLSQQVTNELTFKPNITVRGQVSKSKFKEIGKKEESAQRSERSPSLRSPVRPGAQLEVFERLHSEAMRRREAQASNRHMGMNTMAVSAPRNPSPYVRGHTLRDALYDRLSQPRQVEVKRNVIAVAPKLKKGENMTGSTPRTKSPNPTSYGAEPMITSAQEYLHRTASPRTPK